MMANGCADVDDSEKGTETLNGTACDEHSRVGRRIGQGNAHENTGEADAHGEQPTRHHLLQHFHAHLGLWPLKG